MKKIFVAAIAVLALGTVVCPAFAGSQMRFQAGPDFSNDIDGLKSSQARQDEQIGALQTDVAAVTDKVNNPPVDPWYVKVQGKYVMATDTGLEGGFHNFDMSDGYGTSVGFGKTFGQFSLGLVTDYQKNDVSESINGDVSMITGMVEAIYDIPVYYGFSAYLTGGMGTAKTSITVDNIDSDSSYTFAYKLGAGVSYSVTSQLKVDVGYEYLAATDVSIENADFGKIDSNNVVAGVRYSF